MARVSRDDERSLVSRITECPGFKSYDEAEQSKTSTVAARAETRTLRAMATKQRGKLTGGGSCLCYQVAQSRRGRERSDSLRLALP